MHLADAKGRTAWHLAAQYDHIEILTMLASHTAELNYKRALSTCDHEGLMPLHYAAQASSSRTLAVLLTDTVNPSAKSCDGRSVYHYAAQSAPQNQAQWQMLHEHGSQLRLDLAFDAALDGSTPLHDFAMVLDRYQPERSIYCHIDSRQSVEKAISFLCKIGLQVSAQRLDLATPLHLVCSANGPLLLGDLSYCAFKCLVSNGANVVLENAQGKSCIALLFEEICNHLARGLRLTASDNVIRKTLLGLDYISKTDLAGIMVQQKSPLSIAARLRLETLCLQLMECGADVDRRDEDEQRLTPLEELCSSHCSSAVLEKALQCTTKLHNITERGLLHFACAKGTVSSDWIVPRLLRAGIDVDQLTKEKGLTASMLAAQDRSLQTIRVLLEHGADVTLVCTSGCNALSYACNGGEVQAVALFLEHRVRSPWVCASFVKPWINDEKGAKHGPFELAVYTGNQALVEYLLMSCQTKVRETANHADLSGLWISSLLGDVDMLRLLLDHDMDPDAAKGLGGSHPLHAAAFNGHLHVVTALLDHGCDPATLDNRQRPAAALALSNEHNDVARLLMDRMRGTNTYDPTDIPGTGTVNADLEHFTRNRRAYIPLAEKAMAESDIILLKALLELGMDVNMTMSCGACSLLMYALTFRRLEMARLLVERAASITSGICAEHRWDGFTVYNLAVWDKSDSSLLKLLFEKHHCLEHLARGNALHPLHVAAAGRNAAALRMILETIANKVEPATDPASAPDNDRATQRPSSRVCTCSLHPHLVLEKQIDIRAPQTHYDLSPTVTTLNIPSGTALHVAAYVGEVEITKMLIKSGAVIDSLDAQLYTPLHLAAMSGHLEVARTLLAAGANPNLSNIDLKTPSMLAARHGELRALRLLCNSGGDLSLADVKGRLPIHFCVENGHSDVLSFLLSIGQSIDHADSSGTTPLSMILRSNNSSLVAYALSGAFVLDWTCLRRTGILNPTTNEHHPWRLKKIIKRLPCSVLSLFINARDRYSEAPLYTSALDGRLEALKSLLEAGALVNLEGGPLGTPIMAACAGGRLSAVMILCQAGAVVRYETRNGEVISALAAAKRFPDVVRWLLVRRHTEKKLLCYRAEAPMGAQYGILSDSGVAVTLGATRELESYDESSASHLCNVSKPAGVDELESELPNQWRRKSWTAALRDRVLNLQDWDNIIQARRARRPQRTLLCSTYGVGLVSDITIQTCDEAFRDSTVWALSGVRAARQWWRH